MHSPWVMLFSAARSNRLCARRRPVADRPASAAAPSANGSATTVPATAAESSASRRTIQSEDEEDQETGDKADDTRQNHEWPTAACLGKGLSDNHSLCASL